MSFWFSSYILTQEGAKTHPLLALAGAVVKDLSKNFGAHCLHVFLFLVLPHTGGGVSGLEKQSINPSTGPQKEKIGWWGLSRKHGATFWWYICRNLFGNLISLQTSRLVCLQRHKYSNKMSQFIWKIAIPDGLIVVLYCTKKPYLLCLQTRRSVLKYVFLQISLDISNTACCNGLSNSISP